MTMIRSIKDKFEKNPEWWLGVIALSIPTGFAIFLVAYAIKWLTFIINR